MILCDSLNDHVGLVRGGDRRLYVTEDRLEVSRQLLELVVEAEEVLGQLGEVEVAGTQLLLQSQVRREGRRELRLQASGVAVVRDVR